MVFVHNAMIIARIKGGLGNQLFQYAAGRSLALKTGLPLALDLRHYHRTREHGYALAGFDLANVSLGAADLPPLLRKRPFAYCLSKLANRHPPLVRETGHGFDPAIAAVIGPVWLEGYFQSERYFRDTAATIRTELTPTSPLDPENARWHAEISSDPRAVSLHIRRGDYVRNQKFAAAHGTCTPDYYTRALAHVMQNMNGDPVIYAFSDDPDWVRENLKLPAEMKVVGHNDASRNVQDMRLMAACRHHIIANSSFSWWGAWLNPRADKIVAAPKVWFADPALTNPDIWADGWTQITG